MAAKAVTIKATASKGFIDFKSILFWVLAIVFVCYANSLTNGYNMDDEIVTINHPLTSKGLSAIPDILKSPYFQSDIYSYEYRPVVHISFAIEHQFLGQSPFVSHLINLLLYLILVVVTFQLLKMLFPLANEMILGAIVLLWALHPTHTEVVCSIKNRDEILALLFAFLAWKEAIKFVQGKQWWRILLVVLLFNLAMGAKVTVVAFAILVPLSILLFKTFDAKRLVGVSLVLSISGASWITQILFIYQLAFVLLTPLIIGVTYLYNHYKTIFKLSEASPANAEQATQFDSIYSAFNTGNFLIFALIAILNALVIYTDVTPLKMLAVIVVPLLLAAVTKTRNHLFWLLVFVILLIESTILFAGKEIAVTTLNFIFLLLGYFFVRKSFSYITLIPVIAFAAAVAIYTEAAGTLFMLLNFAAYRQFKFKWVILVLTLVALVSLASDLFTIGRKPEHLLMLLDFIFLNAINFWVYSNKKLKSYTGLLVGLYFVVIIAISLSFSNASTTVRLPNKVKTQLDITNRQNTNIIPSQTYRPILFAEFPIDIVNDPKEIKIGTSAYVLLRYLKLAALPYPLSFYYGFSEITPISIYKWQPILSVLLHLMLVVAAVFFYKRSQLISFGIIFYIITIIPFSAYLSPIPGVIADRYLFASSLGFSMFFMALIFYVSKIDSEKLKQPFATISPYLKYSIGFVLCIYASLTMSRNSDWQDRITLFQNDIKNVPNSAQAHNLLAYHLNRMAQEVKDPFERKKLMEDAAAHFKRATEIWPEFMNATYDLGRTHEQLGNWNKAVAAYKRTFEIDTSFSDAIFRMGVVYEAENKLDSAIIAYQFVTEDNPLNITAFNNLSYCYFKKQEYRNAIETGRRSSFYHPTNTDPIVNIGKTFLHIKENDSALYYFEKVYPNRADDKGLTEVLYKLWNEKGNIERSRFYYKRMQVSGMVR